METKIDFAKTEEEFKKADKLLNKLIQYESGFSRNINKDFVVENFYINNQNNNNCLAIARDDENNIVGFLFGYKRFLTSNIFPVGYIDALFVEEDYRRKGISKKLIAFFEKWAISKGAKELELNVLYNNLDALKVYEKLNFKINNHLMSKKI